VPRLLKHFKGGYNLTQDALALMLLQPMLLLPLKLMLLQPRLLLPLKQMLLPPMLLLPLKIMA